MSAAANYSAHELLRDGSAVEIRAIRPEDEPGMLAAVVHNRCSAASL